MKNLLIYILILCILVVLYSVIPHGEPNKTTEDQYDLLLGEYSDLEKEYYDVSDDLEKTQSALCDLNDYYIVAWSYYDDSDPDITEEKAHEAFLKIGDILHELGY